MFIQCSVVLLFLSCATTTENLYGDRLSNSANDFNRFSFWPSVHNGATFLRIGRAVPHETEVVKTESGVAGPNEGENDVPKPPAASQPTVTPAPKPVLTNNVTEETKSNNTQINQQTTDKVPGTGNKTETSMVAPLANSTAPVIAITEKAKTLDLNNPGVVKRGIIVFGGFALMAVAYFIFYRRKNKHNEMGNALGMNDANQFRYGVLENEDMKDNLESSRIPLTMESEDEIDDDLEIFDLMQKKKSLSYVNLQQNDEDIVLSRTEVDIEGDNLLLDIEDASSDTLINWTNGNKSNL